MSLKHTEEIRVRFNDADPMGVVWHGNYIQYMEDAREGFGREYGLAYLNIHAKDYVIPLVNVNCNYKIPLRYGDIAVVEVEYINTEAAKVVFDYKIYRKSDMKLAANGQTTQVFLEKETFEMQLRLPQFIIDWKAKYGY